MSANQIKKQFRQPCPCIHGAIHFARVLGAGKESAPERPNSREIGSTITNSA